MKLLLYSRQLCPSPWYFLSLDSYLKPLDCTTFSPHRWKQLPQYLAYESDMVRHELLHETQGDLNVPQLLKQYDLWDALYLGVGRPVEGVP